MKNIYQNKLNQAMTALSFQLEEMTELESKFFRKKLLDKFTNGRDLFPLWENITDRFSICEKDAWKWLDEFIQNRESYLFFEEDSNPIIYILHPNQSVVRLLAEFPFIFYLTNESLDFLITQNDHDYLIAAGTAEPWLRDKAIELSKTGWKDMDGKSFE